MPNDINYYYIATLLIVVITIFYVYNATVNYFGFKQRQTYVDKHINYIAILDYYMEKAFDIIYKDRMLVYSIEGSKPSDEDVKTNPRLIFPKFLSFDYFLIKLICCGQIYGFKQ